MSVAPVEVQAPILNSGHRCDRCQSRAYVVTVLRWSPALRHGGELLWCAHHAKKYLPAMEHLISVLIDERYTLTKHATDDGGPR
jgi:hypothetical protein